MEEIAVAPGWRERLEELGGRRKDAALLAVVVVALAFVALVVWGRSAPARVAPPATAETPADLPPVAEQDLAATGTIYVHVAGAVRAPGLYALETGARVWDAIEAAGGAARRADLDLLNLAQILTDGMKVEVPRRGDAPAGTTVGTGDPGAESSAAPMVSINTGDQAALEQVPGLGPVKAGAIVRYREEIGPFTALEQVLEVSGIGPATFEAIRPFITL